MERYKALIVLVLLGELNSVADVICTHLSINKPVANVPQSVHVNVTDIVIPYST